MIARMNRVSNDLVEQFVQYDSRPRANYYKVREEKYLFPDTSLLDPLDADHHLEVEEGVKKLVQDATGTS